MEAFSYRLPPERIAQEPVEPRSSARLLVATDAAGGVVHRTVDDLPGLLEPGDLLVVNDTRVMPARLRLTKATGGQVEVLVLELDEETGVGVGLVRPSRKVAVGTVLCDGGDSVVEVGPTAGPDGEREIKLLAPLVDHGTVPLPPYIDRALADPERYQTVYANRAASAAAPTAGLHLTHDVLDGCRARGAEVATVDLAVGLATFKPITADRVEDHQMHRESYVVSRATMEAARSAQRVIAVGTTTVRALEAAARGSLSGTTDLFIRSPFEFRVVDVLLTNFHMPRSSLLVLLDAFCGPRWRELYECTLAHDYRFLSFGDAMLVARQ